VGLAEPICVVRSALTEAETRTERIHLVMSYVGQKRRFDRCPVTSGLPRLTDILSVRRHVSKVPKAVMPEKSAFDEADLVNSRETRF
jgi:hypothetical protein